MTLEEGIKYYEEEAKRYETTEKYNIVHINCGVGRYVRENKQLAAWLKELKDARNTLHAMYGRIGYP